MARVKLGDIFEIETSKGNAYLHLIHKDNETGELVRVLKGLYRERPISFDDIVRFPESFMVCFPLSAANRKKRVRHVGNSLTTTFEKPKYMRTEHNVRGEFLGWHIIDTNTWERQLIRELTPEQKLLSPWGTWNDTLLIENLENGWSLDKWC